MSGGAALVGNGYVTSRAAHVFWPALPAYLHLTEGMAAGQGTVGGLLTLAVAGAALYALRGPLPRLLLWWLLAPYLWLTLQRVLPPERVLLYKSEALFLLLGLLAGAAARRVPAARRRTAAAAAWLAATAFVGYQLYQVERLNRANRRTVAAYHAAWQWLARQPAGAALVPEPRHRLYFQFYTATEGGPPRILDAAARPGRHYRYQTLWPPQPGTRPVFSGVPAFRNPQAEIWVLP